MSTMLLVFMYMFVLVPTNKVFYLISTDLIKLDFYKYFESARYFF